MSEQPQPEKERRSKDTAQLRWETKPRRAPNPRDIEFQTAEVVISNPTIATGQLGLASLFDSAGDPTTQNRLIWGDCLLACQALLAQGYKARVDLIYIDPPFKSNEDYSHGVRINARETVTKVPSMLERLAYRDMWVGGIDSYLDMLYPRLQLMRRLLAPHGSLYLHIGTDVSAYVRVLLDEIFGRDRFESEIVWKRTSAHTTANRYGPVHDVIFFYSRSDAKVWQPQEQAYSEEYLKAKYSNVDADGRPFRVSDITGAGVRSGETGKPWRGFDPNTLGRHWTRGPEELEKMDAAGLIYWPKNGGWPGVKRHLQGGLPLQDIWTDISPVNSQAKEDTGFDTQKPEELLKRIIETSSRPGDLVADFFLGSGTTAVVAEKLGRRWIGADFGKTWIQVSRSRLVEAQAKPFVLQNLGNYQREMILPDW